MFRLGKYRHYKGKEYEVIGIAKHSETLEETVVYQALYGEKGLWVRPMKMFFEEVEVDGNKMPRFEYIVKQSDTMNKLKFKLKPGQIDYTNARWAPVINCVVKYKNKILMVQRSKDLNFYPGYWNGISGFLDDKRSFEKKVKDELKEELGLPSKNIIKIKLGEIFHQDAPKYKKSWIVHPVLVEVLDNKIKLDWEARNFKWVKLEDVKKLKLLPGFNDVLKKLSKRLPQ